MVDLGDETAEGSGGNPDLATIVCAASCVDVEAGENLANGLVYTQYNL